MTSGTPTPFKWHTLLYRLVFILAAVAAWYKFRNYFVSDAIAQLAIAEHVQNGEWHFVANGYWSVLTSWLLAPLTAILPLNAMEVFRLMNLVLAAASVHFSVQILRHYMPQKQVAGWAACGVAALLPFWALYYLTADMLFLTLLLACLWLYVSGRFYQKPLWTAFCGLLLLLTKAYGLFFFLAFGSFLLFFSTRAERKQNALNWARTLIVFLAAAAVWVVILSKNYGHFTYSESARYNSVIAQHRPLVHPCDTMGLIPPKPGYRYSAWEDITRHIALQQTGNAVPFYTHIPANTDSFFLLLNKTPRYGLWLLAAGLIAVFFITKSIPRGVLLLLFTAIVFSGGYLLLFVEERYLLFPVVLLYMAGIVLFVRAAERVSTTWKYIIMLPLLYSLIRPAVDIYLTPVTREEDAVADIAAFLREKDKRTAVVFAAFNPYQAAPLAWHNKWTDAGGLAGYRNNSSQMLNDIQQFRVEYIILPKAVALPEALQSLFEWVYADGEGIFTVYKRKIVQR